MAVKKHGVHFDITAENATDRAMRSVENNLEGISKAAAAVGRVMQGAFVATFAISAGKEIAAAAIEAEQASKRLDAVLKATGHSAGLTKKQLDQMADSMAESTQFDDESLRNAQAQMLKFGNIHGDTFREAMKLSADLAAFMGTDLNSAVQAVGKALTSPTEGMTALERQVGKFNPAAKEMIKSLSESGKEAEAQGVVLETLKGKIGGAAEALNTGLSKAAGDAKKQWSEMLEAIGRTGAFQRASTGGLSLIENNFRQIKDLIENGTWYEKAIALMSLGPHGQQARLAGWGGVKMTPTPPDATNNVKGAIGGMANLNADPFGGSAMSEKGFKDWNEMRAMQKKFSEEQKKLGEERTREYLRISKMQAESQAEFDRERAEGSAYWGNWALEQEEKRAKDTAQMWKQVYETIDREQEELIEQGRVQLEGIEAEAKKASDQAAQLGMMLTSAFSDAVLSGKGLGGVFKGLVKDIGQMIIKATILDPLMKSITGAIGAGGGIFGGGGLGGILSPGGGIGGGVPIGYDFFAGGGVMTSMGPVPLRRYAGGGVASSPQLAMFGEGSGAEAYVPLPDGRSIPVSMKGGGGMNITINAEGADSAALRRVESAVVSLHQSFEGRAVGAVTRAYNRRGYTTPLG